MNRKERAQELRANENRHYNCAQAVVLAFPEYFDFDEEALAAITDHFGSGMLHGGACGTVSGGLMVLGAAGCSKQEAGQFLSQFRSEKGCIECAQLLKHSAEAGIPKKQHCDGLILDQIDVLEKMLDKTAE